jgi:hypothetical protein
MTLPARRRPALALLVVVGALAWPGGLPQVTAQAGDARPATDDSRIWIGRAAEFEAYLRTAEVVRLEALSTGVTSPRKAHLAPGGPVGFFAWKTIRPGMYRGYRESYLSEIAAYEIDKLIGLNMVPPTVEREYRNQKGAAVLWIAPARSFRELGGVPTPPPALADAWARQIVKAKMFDNLINNVDPNLGNWLVDPAWNLILIDHTRAFPSGRRMVHEFTRVDEDVWGRMKALTEPMLREALNGFLSAGEIRGLVERRDRMREMIDELVRERGEEYVFMRPRHIPGGQP